MPIRTKIVATVGPACAKAKDIEDLACAGVDVFRINFSHGDDAQRQHFLDAIRAVEKTLGEPLAIMGDLCGPKIRVGLIRDGSMLLAEGQEIVIVRQPVEGDLERISTTMAEVIDELEVGQGVLIDDGKIRLEVVAADPPDKVVCRTVRGGVLSSGKGVNLPHTPLKTSALTENDRRHLKWIAERDFDFVALSFVRSADDVRELRGLMEGLGCAAHIVAKIEKPQALNQIERIVDVSDAIMVARGDLGVEMDLPAVPVAQKRIARLCHCAGKPCIIATQMLETMTHSAVPTRAEVSDVANAVLDHADAVMLSGETSVGEFPVQSVRMMDSVVREVQAYHDEVSGNLEGVHSPVATSAALASAVRAVIAGEDIAAVAVFTATGTTARLLAKSRLTCPVVAMSPDVRAVRRMCLYYGVLPVLAKAPSHTRDVVALAERLCLENKVAAKGERIVILSGRPIGKPGATNTLVVHTMGEATQASRG
jgi:pyruvate kinase